MLRVLHVVTTAERRGAQLFAADLHRALSDRGWQSTLVALAATGSGGIDEVEALGPRRLGARALRALRRRGRAADVVVAHGSTTLPACAIALFGTATPFVYRSIGDIERWQTSRARRARTSFLLRRAKGVSPVLPDGIDRLSRFGVDPNRIRPIPNGADPDRFAPCTAAERAEARQRLGLGEADRAVAFVGALTEEKEPATAIEAVARIDGAVLLVAGDGPERARLEPAAQARGTSVRFVGAIADVPALLHASDAVVISSRTEGMPAVAIEAALCGVPVAATDVGAMAAVVDDGVTGFLARPSDLAALETAVRSALGAGPAVGLAARQRAVERFSMDAVAAAWDQWLRELLSPARDPAPLTRSSER